MGGTGSAYGYTLTIWGTGGFLLDKFGLPTVESVFAFVAGGTAGYLLLAMLSWGRRRDHPQLPPRARWENLGALPALAVGYAVVWPLSPPPLAAGLAALAATLAYLILLSALGLIFMRLNHGRQEQEGAA